MLSLWELEIENSVEAVRSSDSEMTFSTFLKLFPDNDSCLDYLREKFHPDGSTCPECGQTTKFHRIKGPLGIFLPVLRPPRLPNRGHDFSQVHDIIATLVLGDLPNVLNPMRHQCKAVGARDRCLLSDRASYVQEDPVTLGRR